MRIIKKALQSIRSRIDPFDVYFFTEIGLPLLIILALFIGGMLILNHIFTKDIVIHHAEDYSTDIVYEQQAIVTNKLADKNGRTFIVLTSDDETLYKTEVNVEEYLNIHLSDRFRISVFHRYLTIDGTESEYYICAANNCYSNLKCEIIDADALLPRQTIPCFN